MSRKLIHPGAFAIALLGSRQHAALSGDNQRGVTGHPLSTPLKALVVDNQGNPVSGIEITFQVVTRDLDPTSDFDPVLAAFLG